MYILSENELTLLPYKIHFGVSNSVRGFFRGFVENGFHLLGRHPQINHQPEAIKSMVCPDFRSKSLTFIIFRLQFPFKECVPVTRNSVRVTLTISLKLFNASLHWPTSSEVFAADYEALVAI